MIRLQLESMVMSTGNIDKNERPVVVTVFGIILIIQGILTLCCCVPLGIVGMLIPDFEAGNPQNYMTFLYATIFISAVEVI